MKRADLGSRAPNPRPRRSRYPDQCDCESVHCQHNAGSCESSARYLVRAFGMKQKLCDDCLAVATTNFPDRLETLRNWE